MRRALGLQGSGRPVAQQRPDQARARHKFVQDGGVPVVVLNRSEDATAPFKARISELEASLEAEKAAHAATRRALHDAQLAGQALQTRLTHAELAHSDFLAAERQAREAAEVARLQAVQRLAATQAKPVRRKPAPVSAAEREAQPVKWWLPNYKAKSN
ncbi:MAG TPA: hypothetical protein VGC15_17440 [Acetobacteraceae bacterium]